MGNYRELIAWQKAMRLVVEIYRATESFPRQEMYGLTSQMRRAAVSVPSNVAEGQSRRTDLEFAQFLGNARGSVAELETQILIAEKLGYLPHATAEQILPHAAEVGRLVSGLLDSLRKAHHASV